MPCEETNPCEPCTPYDNCGCLNPTTFECVTKPGVCAALGITDDMNGKQALAAACAKVAEILESKGKVLIDENDTCPENLWDKLEEGLNISFTQTGSGCDKKIVINSSTGGVAVDVNAKVSAADTVTGYLYDKIDGGTYLAKSILNPGANEVLRLQLVPSTLLSTDVGNQLVLGGDGKLKTLYTTPDGSETKVINGVGTSVTGTGTLADPYIVSTNPSIQVVRPCFDSIWRNVTLVSSGNANVVYSSGVPQYRYRYDGTVEFRGSITYAVSFGAYTSGDRKFTIPMANIPITCLTAGELGGIADLKGINYIDIPQASADQITQQYGYIIRKSAQNLILEFQSSFIAATAKSIVVNFEGAVMHPAI